MWQQSSILINSDVVVIFVAFSNRSIHLFVSEHTSNKRNRDSSVSTGHAGKLPLTGANKYSVYALLPYDCLKNIERKNDFKHFRF